MSNNPRLIIFYHSTAGNNRTDSEFLEKSGLNYDIINYNQQDFTSYEELSTKARHLFYEIKKGNLPSDDRSIEPRTIERLDMSHENEMSPLLRPWLYPEDTEHHLQFLIMRIDEPSTKGLQIRVIKGFVNEGTFPAKSVVGFLTSSGKAIENFKTNASSFEQSAIFPGRKFKVDVPCFFQGLEILENKYSRPLSYKIYIGILLEYEYGTEEILRHGYYKGLFGVDRLVYEDTLDHEVYSPLLFTVKEEFG